MKRQYKEIARNKSDHQCDVIWLTTGRTHKIIYGAEVFKTTDSLEAGHNFGECIRHQLECDFCFDIDN